MQSKKIKISVSIIFILVMSSLTGCGRYEGYMEVYRYSPIWEPWKYGPGSTDPVYPIYGPLYYWNKQNPMTQKEAERILQNYLSSSRNPNLVLGQVREKGDYFETEVFTSDNSLVDVLIINKYSGMIRSIYVSSD